MGIVNRNSSAKCVSQRHLRADVWQKLCDGARGANGWEVKSNGSDWLNGLNSMRHLSIRNISSLWQVQNRISGSDRVQVKLWGSRNIPMQWRRLQKWTFVRENVFRLKLVRFTNHELDELGFWFLFLFFIESTSHEAQVVATLMWIPRYTHCIIYTARHSTVSATRAKKKPCVFFSPRRSCFEWPMLVCVRRASRECVCRRSAVEHFQ